MSLARSMMVAFVALCLIEKSGVAADADKAPQPLQAAVTRLAALIPSWKVQHTDPTPSVSVEGQKGYRVVFRHKSKEPPAGTRAQQRARTAQSDRDDDPTYVTRHTDWHFVLVPVSDTKLTPEAKREILWHVPDEKEYRLPVALGEGHGFVWFSYISIPMQQFIRSQLKLTGGDDLLQLALLGLSVDNCRSGASSTGSWMFAELGDKGFAALDQIIRESEDPSHTARRCKAIHALKAFRDARTTERLIELYSTSKNKEIRNAAEYILISHPVRPDAKPVFLGMIRDRTQRLSEAIDICVQLDLKEAAPLVGAIVEKPTRLREYLQAYPAYRKLSGKPINVKLIEAEGVIENQSGWSPEKIPRPEEVALARRTILESPDIGAAAFVAFSLSRFVTKSNNLAIVNNDGIEILRKLPRPMIENKFQRLLNHIQDESERADLLKLFRLVTGTVEQERQ